MKLKSIRANVQPCPCGSEEVYADCCGVWHQGLASGAHAPTPQELMRSRYSAYVLGLLEYLNATWHGSTAPGDLELPPTKWLGLEVRHFEAAGDAGLVEFVARYRTPTGKAERLHELSRFVREETPRGAASSHRWLYIDGQMMGED